MAISQDMRPLSEAFYPTGAALNALNNPTLECNRGVTTVDYFLISIESVIQTEVSNSEHLARSSISNISDPTCTRVPAFYAIILQMQLQNSSVANSHVTFRFANPLNIKTAVVLSSRAHAPTHSLRFIDPSIRPYFPSSQSILISVSQLLITLFFSFLF